MSSIFKPIIKGNAKMFGIFVIVMGLISMCIGTYMGFFKGSDYVKTKAVISRVEKNPDYDPNFSGSGFEYFAYVTYTVDGREYTAQLDSWTDSYKVGKEVPIKYDPVNPEKITEDSGMYIYFIAVGALLIAAEIFTMLKNRKQRRQLAMREPEILFRNMIYHEEEKELYFLTDLGTPKGGCHIEDANREILYEAKCTNFSLVADSEYDFIDHVYPRTVKHLAGKTVTTTSSFFLAIDAHSTFTVDGLDVWKLLHENGIEISTGLRGIRPVYTIYRDGVKIAEAESSGYKVHEEDQKNFLDKLPTAAAGFYKIYAHDDNLDAIFLTLFAIGRTDMFLYE
ncbi:MAG: hypothetical protein II186_01095 [Erysipelotrichales bacterium]|nr:hypothetical protein [Erysipelotrichales bacterium]